MRIAPLLVLLVVAGCGVDERTPCTVFANEAEVCRCGAAQCTVCRCDGDPRCVLSPGEGFTEVVDCSAPDAGR